MLELEDGGWDVEDATCVVDDMKAMDCSGSLVQREGSGKRERLDKTSSFKVRIDAVPTMQVHVPIASSSSCLVIDHPAVRLVSASPSHQRSEFSFSTFV